ncbi:MAG: hypothetical protein ACP5XB_23195 [Isosphaeraceae bacterium]
MSLRMTPAVGLFAVGVVCAAVASGGFMGSGQVGPSLPGAAIPKLPAQPAAAMLMAAAMQGQPVWSVDVLSGLNLDQQDQQLYQNMATVLTGVSAIPVPRATFWSAVAPSINGWLGSVSDVVPDGLGGNLVTVLAGPTLSTGVTPILDYAEQWDVDANGNPTFVQILDPEGQSGQAPAMVID